MHTKIINLGLALTAAAHVTGCTATEDTECLPGDIDCSEEQAGGKADGWDYTNDPKRLANALQYRLADLPKTGKIEKHIWRDRFPNAPADMNIIWAESYFPSARGSTNWRWQGAGEKSALEKYDQAFNNATGAAMQPANRCGADAKAQWDAYIAQAGPAAKWHTQYFQTMANGYNGIDDDGNGQVDECSGGMNGFGPDNAPAGWWGLCPAWAAAALLEPEATNPVTYNGVTFQRSDILGLLMTVYDDTDALMLGGRCNAQTFDPTNTTSANDSCLDTNPGSMHVILGNFIGIADQALVFDRTAGSEVWNQPIYSYEVSKQDEVSASAANTCVGATGSTWTYNTKAKKLYEVELGLTYVVEPQPSRTVIPMTSQLATDSYHYILELDGAGKIIGGRYCSDSLSRHADFMWAPLRASAQNGNRNPNVKLDKVRQLLKLSVEGGTSGGGGGSGQEFTGTGNVSIPDNSPTGATSEARVTGVSGSGGASVSVDISHTYRGDLVVTLVKDGRDVKTLHDRAGGSADDLVETYTLTAAELGTDRNGTYVLKVIDTAAQDSGTLNSWKLVF